MLCTTASLQVHSLKICKLTGYRCILWKFVNLQLIGLYFTARMFLGCNLLPTWNTPIPPTWWGRRIWAPPGNPWKTIKFQACSQYPQISLKVCPRSPKVTKMTPETLPGDTKLVNTWKKWNISKTLVFTMVIAHTASASWHHFHPWITKKMDLEPVSHFDTSNQQKIRKVPPMWAQETPQRHPKINKNEHLDPNVSIGRPSGSLDHQSCPQGTQTEASRSPKWQL